MDWPEFLESLNPQESTLDLYSASPHENREATAQTDRWTPEEKQIFENAFSRYNNLDSQTFFEFIASKIPHKSMEEIKNYYINLFKEVERENSLKNKNVVVVDDVVDDDHHHDQQHHQVSQEDNSSDKEATFNDALPQVEINRSRRRRGVPWTEGEHSLFLMGLNRYGKGDWKSISRRYVLSKTPTQVASHAQKYFSRRTSRTPVDRRRPSINDIQTVTLNSRRTTTTTTTVTTTQINNNIHAYNNNSQVGSSSMPFHSTNYTFGGPTFTNNSIENFGRYHQGEASGSNLFVVGRQNNNNNNNNLRRPVSPRPFLSMYLSSTRGNNPQI